MYDYELVFDAAADGHRALAFSAFGLIFVAAAAGMLLWQRRFPAARSNSRIAFPFVFGGLGVLWTLLVFTSTGGEYLRLRDALRSGKYTVVEGRVTDFHPIAGKSAESFAVGSYHYSYGDFQVSAAFNHSASEGGPIHEGLQVRIADVNGQIARLEIAPEPRAAAPRP